MRIPAVVLVLGLLSPAWAAALAPLESVAHADDAQRAKELYEEGTRYFDLGQFDKAIDAWQAGYREKADPRFLYNIAQAYRLAGDNSKAIFFYKGYLRNAPKASNRTEVEQKIQSMQKQSAEEPGKGGAHPTTAAPPASPAPAPPASPPPAATATAVTTPPPAPPPATADSHEPAPPMVTGGPEATPPTISTPAYEPSPLETLRPIDLGVAVGVDGWSSGVQGKADASFALLLAGGYTFGSEPAAPVRFRMGGSFGYTFLKEAQSNETFLSLLAVPTIVIRASPRLGFFGELGVGLVGISGLKPSSALLDHSQMLKINGTQSLAVIRPALGATLRLTAALGLFASAAANYSPKGEHFYQAINRPELLLGATLHI